MAKWRQQLATRPGEASLRRGWRISRASWRVLRGDTGLRTLALLLAALAAAITVGSSLLAFELGPGTRRGDLWVLQIADVVVYSVLATYLLAGLAERADAAVDGDPLEPADALLDAWDRRGTLLAWGLLYGGVVCVLQTAAFSGAVPVLAATLANIVWGLVSFFAIPALILDTDQVGPALAASVRVLRRRWQELLAGIFRIGLAAGLLSIFAGILISIGIDQADRTLERGAGLGWMIAGYGLGAAIVGVATATSLVFALLLYRDAQDDLPEVEPEPADPMRLRRAIAVATAIAFGVLVLAGVVGAFTADQRPSRSSADGYYCIVYDRSASRAVEDGMPVRFRGHTVGHVVEHDVDESSVLVVYWLEPGARHLLAETDPVIYNPQPGRYVIRLTQTARGELS
ncbi:MAG: hypothetical protein R2725_06295 [Solirubrobacterales bacterium]